MSQALVWSITKNSHSNFLKSRKNGGVQFDKNPANLKNKNSLKFSGHVNQRAVSIQAGPNNKGVVMPIFITNWKHFTPKSNIFLKFSMKLGGRTINWGAHKGQRQIVVKASNVVGRYNSNLRGAAQKRVSAILRAQK